MVLFVSKNISGQNRRKEAIVIEIKTTRKQMKLVSSWEDHGDRYYTVELPEGGYVDVKYPCEEDCMPIDCVGYSYCMQCENGNEVYYPNGNGEGYRNLSADEENEILHFVDREISKSI